MAAVFMHSCYFPTPAYLYFLELRLLILCFILVGSAMFGDSIYLYFSFFLFQDFSYSYQTKIFTPNQSTIHQIYLWEKSNFYTYLTMPLLQYLQSETALFPDHPFVRLKHRNNTSSFIYNSHIDCQESNTPLT